MDINNKLVCTNKEKLIYLEKLIGKIYKILPISEESDDITFNIYINGLLMNISSANQLFDGILIDLMVKINEIYIEKLSHKKIKRIIFDCINKEIPNIKNKIKEGV